MDSHVEKPTVDMFQIFNINLIELGGGTFLYLAPAFKHKVLPNFVISNWLW